MNHEGAVVPQVLRSATERDVPQVHRHFPSHELGLKNSPHAHVEMHDPRLARYIKMTYPDVPITRPQSKSHRKYAHLRNAMLPVTT